MFFKKYEKVITGYPRGIKGNMVMLEADIKIIQVTLEKRKRRFRTKLLVTGYLDNKLD